MKKKKNCRISIRLPPLFNLQLNTKLIEMKIWILFYDQTGAGLFIEEAFAAEPPPQKEGNNSQ